MPKQIFHIPSIEACKNLNALLSPNTTALKAPPHIDVDTGIPFKVVFQVTKVLILSVMGFLQFKYLHIHSWGSQ